MFLSTENTVKPSWKVHFTTNISISDFWGSNTVVTLYFTAIASLVVLKPIVSIPTLIVSDPSARRGTSMFIIFNLIALLFTALMQSRRSESRADSHGEHNSRELHVGKVCAG
jgi:hypothetical protein